MRSTMRVVAVKTAEQQAAVLLHRGRERLVCQRTGLMNALRGHLAEFGIIAPQGLRNVGRLIGDHPMRGVLRAFVVLQALLPLCAFAADEKVLVELNSIESADNRCRLNFVVQNNSRVAIESMKLDLVGFDTDGGIVRRLITEMGPVRATKTVVRAFIVDIDCHQLGAVLVNDVTACAPGEPGTCLDELGLSSRVKTVRLYK